MRRDVGNIQRELVAQRRAAWLGEGRADPAAALALGRLSDVERAAARVRMLFD